MLQSKNSLCSCGSGKKYKRCCEIINFIDPKIIKLAALQEEFHEYLIETGKMSEMWQYGSQAEINETIYQFIKEHDNEIPDAELLGL